jgi:hypothetical protein
LAKRSRVILHPLDQACSLRVAVVCAFIIIIFSAIAFVLIILFVIVWLLAQEEIGSYQSIGRV